MDTVLSSVNALMGKTMDGGGRKRRNKKPRANRKKSAKKSASKGFKVYRIPGMRIAKRYKMGFFGGEPTFFKCEQMPAPVVTAPAAPAPPATGVAMTMSQQPAASGPPQSGGARMKLSAYKRKLDNLSVEKLQKIAARKNVKITKKKDGKTVYLKKATLIRKLCECKIGRKLRKKSAKRSKRRH